MTIYNMKNKNTVIYKQYFTGPFFILILIRVYFLVNKLKLINFDTIIDRLQNQETLTQLREIQLHFVLKRFVYFVCFFFFFFW